LRYPEILLRETQLGPAMGGLGAQRSG